MRDKEKDKIKRKEKLLEEKIDMLEKIIFNNDKKEQIQLKKIYSYNFPRRCKNGI